MTRLNLLMSFLLAGTLLGAQDLHIYFNAAPDNGKNLVYVLNGDTLTHPKVRSGSQIFFHVDNFNNYLFLLTDALYVSTFSGLKWVPTGKKSIMEIKRRPWPT